jgi:hypothetical protein
MPMTVKRVGVGQGVTYRPYKGPTIRAALRLRHNNDATFTLNKEGRDE